jgi:hypothetical protein
MQSDPDGREISVRSISASHLRRRLSIVEASNFGRSKLARTDYWAA